jgi:hypothetical protein
MANYRRIATGNWSNLAQWEDDSSGSYVASTVLPGVSDVVYANAFTVTLDVDIAVTEIRTTTGTNVNAGGLFDFGVATTVTANIFAGSIGIRNDTANTKNIIGNCTGGVVFGANAVRNNASGTINITGNCTGGIEQNTHGVFNNSSGTVNIIGNCTGTFVNASGVFNNSNGIINIMGVCTGGLGNGAILSNAWGANNASTGTLRATTAQSSTLNAGINGGNINGVTVIENLVWGSSGISPIERYVKFDNTSPKSATILLENNTTTTLVDPSSLDIPIEADVRDGITYASGSQTGTLIVPSPSNVRKGVPTDNTVGTAELTAADFWDYLSVSATTVGSMGEVVNRIPLNPSSVQSTGAQIASFNT